MKTISIIIPSRNGIGTISHLLDGIRNQTLYHTCEIICIDSESTDGTQEFLAKQKDVLLHCISAKDFNHGLTRNLGVSLATGDFIVMTVQDATPADSFWLSNMLRHFSNKSVDAVCGQQIVPHRRKTNPHQWYRPVNKATFHKVYFETAQKFDQLSPLEKKQVCSWDDVTSMYRKSILQKVPFREAFFAEDAMWAQDAIRAGCTLIYDKTAMVYHYHYQDYDYTYRRILTQLYFNEKIFGFKQQIKFEWSEYAKIIYRNLKFKAHPKWIFHNFRIIKARNKAFKDFNLWIQKGREVMDSKYFSVCKTPPMSKNRSPK